VQEDASGTGSKRIEAGVPLCNTACSCSKLPLLPLLLVLVLLLLLLRLQVWQAA
jgi:hypothetical protein